MGLDGLYYTGGRPTIDGKKGETRANARVGLTLILPINRYNSVKLYGSTGVYTKTGTDFDLVGSYGNSVGRRTLELNCWSQLGKILNQMQIVTGHGDLYLFVP